MKQLYEQHKTLDKNFLIKKIDEFILEDKANNDITTKHLTQNNDKRLAYIVCEEAMIFAGEQILKHIFENDKCEIYKQDGKKCESGDIIAEVQAPQEYLLTRERIVLNLLQRLSGIATLTAQYITAVNNDEIKILDTRKTTPGLRAFEKYAVTVGGGYNHRMDLEVGSMFKDNHFILSTQFTNLIQTFSDQHPNKKLQIEVDDYKQLTSICSNISCKLDAVLLDNMNPDEARQCINLIRKTQPKCFIELSGGINLNTIEKFNSLDIDGISIGALTHQAQSKNIKLEIQKI